MLLSRATLHPRRSDAPSNRANGLIDAASPVHRTGAAAAIAAGATTATNPPRHHRSRFPRPLILSSCHPPSNHRAVRPVGENADQAFLVLPRQLLPLPPPSTHARNGQSRRLSPSTPSSRRSDGCSANHSGHRVTRNCISRCPPAPGAPSFTSLLLCRPLVSGPPDSSLPPPPF